MCKTVIYSKLCKDSKKLIIILSKSLPCVPNNCRFRKASGPRSVHIQSLSETKSNIREQYLLNTITTNVSHHVETSQLVSFANQLNCFCMMGNTGRQWVKKSVKYSYWRYKDGLPRCIQDPEMELFAKILNS